MSLFVGANSGTSVDSVDVAICEISDCLKQNADPSFAQSYEYNVKLLYFESHPWEKKERDVIFHLMTSKECSAKDFCVTNEMVGRKFGNAIRSTITNFRSKTNDERKIECIGSHGQTVWHEPNNNPPSTLQIGEAAVIAEITQTNVVYDFRWADVAAHGQGAPLTSIQDSCLLQPKTNNPLTLRALQNIGGIGNVTLVSGSLEYNKVVSFDTGPGNSIIDDACRIISNNTLQMDKDGAIAAENTFCEEVVLRILSLDYFTKLPPKTTGRELFGFEFVKQWVQKAKQDFQLTDGQIISSMTEVTARSIVNAYSLLLQNQETLLWRQNTEVRDLRVLESIIVSGGGSHNKELMRRIEAHAKKMFGSHIQVLSHCAFASDNPSIQFDGEAKESVLFAFLAFLYSHKRYASLPEVTGAKGSRILGKLIIV